MNSSAYDWMARPCHCGRVNDGSVDSYADGDVERQLGYLRKAAQH